MFWNKRCVKLERDTENGVHRLTVDYFSVKDRHGARMAICGYLAETYGELLLQVDSNFLNRKMDGRESAWIEALAAWAKEQGFSVEMAAFTRQVAGSVFGMMLGSKAPVKGYRVGILLDGAGLDEVLRRHGEIELGVHFGCGFPAEGREGLLQAFCSARYGETEGFSGCLVDLYDYDMVGRCVLRSAEEEPIVQAMAQLESRLACFNSN